MSQRGWVFSEAGRYPELQELPDPVPGTGEVVLEVRAAGLCHSDIGIIEGPGASWVSALPIVLGHEIAGVVAELGDGAEGFAVGDRVAVSLGPHPFVKGASAAFTSPGLAYDGGYEEKVRVSTAKLVRIPDTVPFSQAAGATDSVVTAYHAVKVTGEVTAGTVVGIIGLGGLGLNAARIAVLLGATVYGVDTKPDVFDTALAQGVTATYTDAADLAQHEPDVIFDFAGFGTTTAAAIQAVTRGGLVVLVGLGVTEATFSTNAIVTRNVELRGSIGGSKQDLVDVYELIASGKLQPLITEIPFEEIGDGLQRLHQGGVTGRLEAIINP
ncbi:zinc-binding dehydrogenase [Microbacterium sp. NPDC076895]|uniref:zinc-binding dehydrogenase n=1 Tax=Microbacterium sp. NPDC076895 TaxID=3154957 RepID=UPI00341A8716